jgi:ABC-type nitrate/sulfonate/bicarbonate transport system ATPase subunit
MYDPKSLKAHEFIDDAEIRATLAYAEEKNATLLLLDEPFSALDSETSEKMIALLKKFAKNKTTLLVTHDESDAESLADRIVRL